MSHFLASLLRRDILQKSVCQEGGNGNVLSMRAVLSTDKTVPMLTLLFFRLNIGFLFTYPWLDGDVPFDIV